eukprot:gene12083-12223_t
MQAEQQAPDWEHDYTEHDYGYTWDGLTDYYASEAMHAPVGDDCWAYAQQQELWQQAWPDMASSWQLEEYILPADESLHLLACWYPEQPKLLLEQVLEACEGNLQQASQVVWDIEWERRQAVSKEYQSARADARDFARVRNTCFQQATLAYLAGNKALAKELSMKGRQAAEQMWAAHEQASQQIFYQRNAPLISPATAVSSSLGASSSSSRAHQVMDLHGLHVREALMMLRQRLQQLAAQQSCSSISLIVGTGHHTKGGPAARLGPAVEQLLEELALSYKEPQPGLLRVQLH